MGADCKLNGVSVWIPTGTPTGFPNLLTDVTDFSAIPAGWELHPPPAGSAMTRATAFTLAAGGLTSRVDNNLSTAAGVNGFPTGISRPHDSNNFVATAKYDTISNHDKIVAGRWRIFTGQHWGANDQLGVFSAALLDYDSAGAGGGYWKAYKVHRRTNESTWIISDATVVQAAQNPATPFWMRYEWSVLNGYKAWCSTDGAAFTELGAGAVPTGHVDHMQAATSSTYNSAVGLSRRSFAAYHGINVTIAGGLVDAATIRLASLTFTGVS